MEVESARGYSTSLLMRYHSRHDTVIVYASTNLGVQLLYLNYDVFNDLNIRGHTLNEDLSGKKKEKGPFWAEMSL